jgi:hypothetical protein
MCCEDLSPFDIVQKPGFVKFLLKNNVIKDAKELPDPTTVSRSGLQAVYDETVSAVKTILKDSPKTIGVTTDMWTDNFKKRSYMTVTVHFCLSNFRMQSMVLCTSVFTAAHTGDNIAAQLKKILIQFGLEDKTLIYITDQGSNIVKACRIAGWERFGCSAHGLHNLIAVDGVAKGLDVHKIIGKVKDIIKTFTFKTSLLEKEAAEMADQKIVADLERIVEEMDQDNEFSMTSGEDDAEDPDNGTEPFCSVSNPAVGPSAQHYMTTLKKDCPTRWNCLLAMLDSVVINQELIERCLTRLRLFDKLCSDEDWHIIRNLAEFLKVFKTATEVLSGSKYPTISLVLLFRAEIVAGLVDQPTDCDVVVSMKQRMRSALNHRLPITELNVVAALLDPSQRNLSYVQEFLTAENTTAVDLLKKALVKYVGPFDTVTHGLQTSRADGAVTDGESPDNPAPWKRAKQELLSKHTCSQPNQDREIQQFRCLSIAPDDVLAWWSTQTETFPTLAMLARIIMAIPATSAPSERIFSIAGLTINAKRSSLAPSTVDKVVFVHENAHFVTEDSDM